MILKLYRNLGEGRSHERFVTETELKNTDILPILFENVEISICRVHEKEAAPIKEQPDSAQQPQAGADAPKPCADNGCSNCVFKYGEVGSETEKVCLACRGYNNYKARTASAC